MNTKPQTTENGREELRNDPRYNMTALPIAKLRFSDDHVAQVIDVSYGGVGIIDTEEYDVPKRSSVKLSVLNRAIECEVIFCHRTKGVVGLQFVHDSENIFSYLREINESLRIGKSLNLERKWENHKERSVDVLRLKSEEEFCSAEIITHNEDDHLDFDQLVMHFKDGKSKCTLTVGQGKIEVEFSGPDPFKECLNESAKSRKKKAMARKCLLMLVGIRNQELSQYIRCTVDAISKLI